ncbi:MAG: undecaprenyl-diphosphate phosphatase [Bacteroidales bacterium]|nr:undecaprenyl-diphosphate phosphatase [Bacteroidales bacterium]
MTSQTLQKVDHSALKANQLMIITLGILAFILDLPVLVAFVALVMGIGQAGAIFPGVSRSGATITAGMLRGLDRPAAARFSFLMSVPVMLAAGVLSIFDVAEMPGLSAFLPPLVLGFISAAVVGYFAIRWLLGYLVRHSLKGFAIYCAVLGLLTIVVALLK